jgi:uncharacterized protein
MKIAIKKSILKEYALAGLILTIAGCRHAHQVSPDYPIHPIPFTQVKITDDFWAKRMEINRKVTIPIAFQKAEETGRIDNFRIAGGLKKGKFSSLYPFDDSDVFKNIEAASYSLQLSPDPDLDAYLDTLISYITAAQETDGYLYTNRTIDPASTHEMAGGERWVNEEESSHELYNAGHLYEAAVAHFQATGKRSLLDVAIKNANLVENQFGWGKIEKAPGHQEIEIGLIKLFRVTGNRKYLDLARFFLDVRGPDGQEYNQMHALVLEQKEARGHAVRAQYMYAAMADIAALTGEKAYQDAIDTLWNDVTRSKTYITGGIGSVRETEGFGSPYELPNMEAYCETCAAIANELWNYRMFLLHGESKYYDVFEKVLYNGFLSGISLSGDHFFYPNPLSSAGQYSRKAWFGCACCPVNITRFLPSLSGYIYAACDDRLYVNLFIGNEARVTINERMVKIIQSTQYPWEGDVSIKVRVNDPVAFKLLVRIPGWSTDIAFPSGLYYFDKESDLRPEIFLNGNRVDYSEEKGYASLSRKWCDGDELLVKLPMAARKVKSIPQVKDNLGKTALQRGPVIYCLEGCDTEGMKLSGINMDSNTEIQYSYMPDTLNGIGTLTTSCMIKRGNEKSVEIPGLIRAIPYYSWANRGEYEMAVWINDSIVWKQVY